MEPTGRANARPMINSAIPIASPCWYPESQTCIAVHPSRRPRSLSSGRALRGPVGGLLRMRSNFVETQQPHAEERATRASRSMGYKRLTYLSQSVLRCLFYRLHFDSDSELIVQLRRHAGFSVRQPGAGEPAIERLAGHFRPQDRA